MKLLLKYELLITHRDEFIDEKIPANQQNDMFFVTLKKLHTKYV